MKSIYNHLLEWSNIDPEFPFINYNKDFKLKDIIYEINSLSSFLREIPNQYIGIYVDSPLDKILLYIASIKVNKTPIMFNDSWSARDIERVIEVYGVDHIISSWSRKNNIHYNAMIYYFEEILNSSRGCGIPSDLDDKINFESVLFTSGTSGHPKAVCLSRENFLMSSKAWDNELKFKNKDCYILCLPIYHIAGLSIIYRAIYYRFKIKITDSYRDINLGNNGTLISLVPSILNRIINDKGYLQQLSSFRAIILGGEPAPQDLLSTCLDLKLNIFISYGMTETCSGIAGFWLHEYPDKIQSSGKAFKGVSISEKNGYLAIGSKMNMKKYFGEKESDLVFMTSDKGKIRDEFIYIDGRDQLIISGGEKINLVEIKNTLLTHNAIDNVHIKVYKSKQWGEAIEANLILNSKITKQEIKDWCKDKLPSYGIPKKINLQL